MEGQFVMVTLGKPKTETKTMRSNRKWLLREYMTLPERRDEFIYCQR